MPEKKPSWLSIVMTYRGSALERIRGRLFAVFVVAAVVTYVMQSRQHSPLPLTLAPFTLSGLALSIFLGFRNNTSYDRFWEGRRLWGGLVNAARTSARRIQLLVAPAGAPGDAEVVEMRRELTYRIIAYIHALRMHLRSSTDLTKLRQWLPEEEIAGLAHHHNVPVAILAGLGVRLKQAYVAGQISEFHLPVLEEVIAELTTLQGGCERIKSTPIPHSYTVLIHRIVAIYCFALPFGLVDTLHGLTPVVVLIVSYAFLGLDAVGDEIEDPFGTDPNDLPLSALSTMIEVNLRQGLGETEVPTLLKPVDGLLS